MEYDEEIIKELVHTYLFFFEPITQKKVIHIAGFKLKLISERWSNGQRIDIFFPILHHSSTPRSTLSRTSGHLKITFLLVINPFKVVSSTDWSADEIGLKARILSGCKLPSVRRYKKISLPFKSARDMERVQCAQKIALQKLNRA